MQKWAPAPNHSWRAAGGTGRRRVEAAQALHRVHGGQQDAVPRPDPDTAQPPGRRRLAEHHRRRRRVPQALIDGVREAAAVGCQPGQPAVVEQHGGEPRNVGHQGFGPGDHKGADDPHCFVLAEPQDTEPARKGGGVVAAVRAAHGSGQNFDGGLRLRDLRRRQPWPAQPDQRGDGRAQVEEFGVRQAAGRIVPDTQQPADHSPGQFLDQPDELHGATVRQPCGQPFAQPFARRGNDGCQRPAA